MAVQYVVRQGRKEDLPGLNKMVVEQGWNNTLEDLQILFELFTEGVVVAESSDGELLSVCASVPLDELNGQVAHYLTKKSCRGQGIGRQVFDLSIKALGNRNVAVHSVWDKVDMYAAGHFKIATLTLPTYEFPVKNFLQSKVKNSSCTIVDIKGVDVDKVIAYDRNIHPMPREKALKWALGCALFGQVALEGDEIKGWGIIQKSRRGYRLMPLYAETPEVAEVIAAELLKQVSGDPESMIQISFPEDNKTAEEVYSNLGVFRGECKHSKYKRMFMEKKIDVPSQFVFSILSENHVLV